MSPPADLRATRALPTSDVDIRRAAEQLLGVEELLPGQAAAIRAVLDGRDTLAVLPTGGGKSAIYQVAGALVAGSTVVISPLLALQRDQLQSIEEMKVGDGAALNSLQRARERGETLDLLEAGRLEFVLLAPEQLSDPAVVDSLAASKPSLFVVDEAHCISEWGHDFRPEYLRLREVIERLGHPRVLALTATAAPPVRQEIIERLDMDDPAIVVRGFDRPNISLEVTSIGDARAKQAALLEAVAAAEPPGIVYAPTRRATEELAAALQASGVAAAAYHAGMSGTERHRVQDAFMADDGVRVIVATTAFGMGVDKPNVRFVFHAAPSESVDAYHQEIGRAGRDGAAARAMLFYRAPDLGMRRYFAARGKVDGEAFARIVKALRRADGALPVATLARRTKLSRALTVRALDRLVSLGACRYTRDAAELVADSDAARVVIAQAEAAEQRRRAYDRSRVEMMRTYAETRECRRNFLLNYFGEGVEGTCGNCDNDLRAASSTVTATSEAPATPRPFELNARVSHLAFGEGTVQHYDDGAMTILFDDAGYKTFDVSHAVEQELLHELPAAAPA